MHFYQCMGYGGSTTFSSNRDVLLTFCGLIQGSKGAPTSWLQISSPIGNAFQSLEYGAMIMDITTRAIIYTIDCLYVDKRGLFIWKDVLRLGEEVWQETQEAVML